MVLTSVLEFSPGTQTTGLSATLPSPGTFSGPQPSCHSTDDSSNANLTVFGLDTSSGVPRFQNKEFYCTRIFQTSTISKETVKNSI